MPEKLAKLNRQALAGFTAQGLLAQSPSATWGREAERRGRGAILSVSNFSPSRTHPLPSDRDKSSAGDTRSAWEARAPLRCVVI